MASNPFSSSTPLEEDKHKEITLAKWFLEDMNDELDDTTLWESLTTKFSGKSLEEIEDQCSASFREYKAAMLGLLPGLGCKNHNMSCGSHGMQEPPPIIATNPSTRKLIATLREGLPDKGTTKGLAWSMEEESLFLLGLECFGKGDWRNISKYFVLSRTPTQIGSHAQKFFTRQAKYKEAHCQTMSDMDIATQVPSDMHNGFPEGCVGFNGQSMMPMPGKIHQPLTAPATEQFLVYHPSTRALVAQNKNEFGGL